MALPEGVKIRSARRGDRDAIYRVLSESGVSIEPNDQSSTLSWIVSHPETEVLVAVDPLDRPQGLVALSHRPSLHVGGRLAVVESLAVLKGARRHGIGGDLLERAMDRARILGSKAVEITVQGEGARAFLTNRGFTMTGGEVAVWRSSAGR
jgi:N-acetylglutamate synthase-like GNAT family acetyltransferase